MAQHLKYYVAFKFTAPESKQWHINISNPWNGQQHDIKVACHSKKCTLLIFIGFYLMIPLWISLMLACNPMIKREEKL